MPDKYPYVSAKVNFLHSFEMHLFQNAQQTIVLIEYKTILFSVSHQFSEISTFKNLHPIEIQLFLREK